MMAVMNDRGRVGLRELRACLQCFFDRFRTARVVISGMNAVLIDGRCRLQDSERVEKMYVVSALGEAGCDRRTVDPSAGDSDFLFHRASWVDELSARCIRSGTCAD